MSDEFDRASDREMADREAYIARARSKNQPIKFTGHCLYCNEQIEQGRYCSAECREGHELEVSIRGRQFR